MVTLAELETLKREFTEYQRQRPYVRPAAIKGFISQYGYLHRYNLVGEVHPRWEVSDRMRDRSGLVRIMRTAKYD